MSRSAARSPISRVAVLGVGYMGTGIAQVLAMAGARCRIADADPTRTETAYQACLRLASQYAERGYLPAEAAATIHREVLPAPSVAAAVVDAELVLEAVTEDAEVKRTLLVEAERHAPPDAILASNTSSITISSLADGLLRPHRMYGIHWFNPPQFLPAVEVVPGPGAESSTTNRILKLLRSAGKEPVVVPDSAGFVVNRLQFALFREAAMMVDEGIVEPEQVDTLVRGSFGYRLPFFGPFAIADIAGLDVYAAVFEVLEGAFGERFSCPKGLRERLRAGDLGLKSGAGYGHFSGAERAAVADRRDRGYLAMRDALAHWQTETTGGPHGSHGSKDDE